MEDMLLSQESATMLFFVIEKSSYLLQGLSIFQGFERNGTRIQIFTFRENETK